MLNRATFQTKYAPVLMVDQFGQLESSVWVPELNQNGVWFLEPKQEPGLKLDPVLES